MQISYWSKLQCHVHASSREFGEGARAEGRTGGIWYGSRTKQRITDLKILVFPNQENKQVRYQKQCLQKEKKRMAKTRLDFANGIPKSLGIDDSNHSEDLRLEIA